MKISNASKKVLASALSAAMVVAFAPTVALATPSADKIKVSYDANGGAAAPAGLPDETVNIDKHAAVYTQQKVSDIYNSTTDTLYTQSDADYKAVAAADVNVGNTVVAGYFADAAKATPASAYTIISGGTYYNASGVEVTYSGDKATAVAAANDTMTAYYKLTAPESATIEVTGGSTYSKGTAAFDKWFIDADNDGVLDEDEVYSTVSGGKVVLSVTGLSASAESVTLKAAYKEVAVSATANVNTSAKGYDAKGNTAVDVTAKNLAKGNYKAVATVNGTAYYSTPASITSEGGAASTSFTVSVPNSALAAGDIQVKVISNETGADVASAAKPVTICAVTYDAGAYGVFQDTAAGTSASTKSYLVTKGTAYTDLVAPAVTSGTTYTASGWALADGTAPAATVDADVTLYAQYNDAKISALTFSNAAKGSLSYTVANVTAGANTKEYKVTISKDGAELTQAIVDKAAINATFGLAFGQSYDTATTVKAAAAAGTYTVAVQEVLADNAPAGTKAISISKSVKVDEINLDLNGGKVKSASAKTFKSTVLAQEGTTLAAAGVTSKFQEADIDAPAKTQTLKGWSVDGVKVIDPSKVTVSGTVALKALWEESAVAKPTLASATASTVNNAEKWALTFANATEGATMTYTAGGVTYVLTAAGITGVANDATVVINAKPAAGSNLAASSETFTGYKKSGGSLTTFDNFANGVLNAATAESQATKPAYYSGIESVKASKTAGEDAIKAKGFATAEDWKSAVDAQRKAVLKAAVDYAVTELDAKKAPVKAVDGKTYSYLADADYNNAVAALNQVLADFDALNDSDDKTVATTKYDGTNVLTDNAANYAAAITYVVKNAKLTSVSAADAEAAQAASAALKAAKTVDEAKAALEAYNKLTVAQKAMVAAADVFAAQEIISKAELAEAQDDAAVSKVKGKTVKAKAKKATKSSLKVVTSKSGAKSTFKKTSGNSKVKVYKSGKIVVKKGLKAGKKYTVKVKATVGTQTKTVKVIVKVAK